MSLVFSAAVAVVFGAGVYLVLERDLLRVVTGIILLSTATNLFIVATGLTRGAAPIYPLPEGAEVSDPVVQALALTAVVIGFGINALVLALLHRVDATTHSLDQRRLRELEEEAAEQRQGGERPS